MITKFSGFIVCFLVCWSCNKIEIPIRMAEAPIFEVKAVLGTQPFNLAAGKENVVLDTRFLQEELGVLKLIGELRKKDCVPPCPSSLKITLRQNNREFISSPSRSIKTGRRPFFIAPEDSLLIQTRNASVLSNSGGASRYSFTWTINDKKFADKENIALKLNPRVRNNVCMHLMHPEGTSASQCQAIDYNLADSFPGLKVNIVARNISNKGWVLTTETSGTGPFKYSWNNKSLDPMVELDIKKASSSCVTVTDTRGNTASSCVDFNPEAKIRSLANFDLIYDQSRLKDFTQFNTVEINFVDDQGFQYSSVSKVQPGTAFFEILEETPYEENDQKQATKKLKLSFDLILYGHNRPNITFKGGGSMAVAYPR